MNIIWLTPEIPYPPIGGRNGVFNRIKQLSETNDIFLFSIAYNEKEKNSSSEMEKYCKEVHYYNRNENITKTIFKSLFLPYSVASRTLPQIKKDLFSCLNNNKIDIVIVDFPNMARNLEGLDLKCFCTLNQHNNEYLRMRDMHKIKTLSYIKRLAYLLESYRLEYYEKKLYNSNKFQSITFFSIDDYNEFKKRWSNCSAELRVFPLGANAVRNYIGCQDDNHDTLLFVGRLDNVATTNVEAITWFCHNVLPKIEEKVEVKIIIAGANPSEKILELETNKVKIIPNYKDLDSVYSLADYVILPLLSGGGVKGKLLEAAAYKKIIISTDHGIEGTDFIPGKHVLLGNTVDDFANMCVKAIQNFDKSCQLANNAKKLFEDKYEWKQIGKDYNEYLKTKIGR